MRSVSERLEYACSPHPGADAHRYHAVLPVVAPDAVHERRGAYRTGCAERMTQRDGAAERVDFCWIEIQFLDDGERLRGKRLVEFDPVHVVERKADLLQDFRDRLHRPDAHDFGRHASDRIAHEAPERLQIE